MNYYAIELSLDDKIMGTYFQAKDYKHNCHVYDDPDFIGQFTFKKVDVDPILSNPILDPSAKLTDIIRVSSVGFPPGSMVISDKLKLIIEASKHYGVQFFPTYLVKDKEKITGYWQSHIFDFPYSLIDYSKSSFFLKNSLTRQVHYDREIKILSYLDFNILISELEFPFTIYIEKFNFIKDTDLDFFDLRFFRNSGNCGIVSEQLKEKIEQSGCVGIEFRPIELSVQEWIHSDPRAAGHSSNG